MKELFTTLQKLANKEPQNRYIGEAWEAGCDDGEIFMAKALLETYEEEFKSFNEPAPKLTDSIDPGNIQTIGELWESLAKYAQGRVDDNKLSKDCYPIEVRKAQMASLHALVDAINEFHTTFSTEEINYV